MSFGLNLNILPQYRFSSFKCFIPNEIHVSRICNDDVLIIMLDGELNFTENGTAIRLHKNQYYIQRSGLKQLGIIPSSTAKYYYIHFNGSFDDSQNNLPIIGNVNSDDYISLFKELDYTKLIGGTLIETTSLFYQILSKLKNSFTISNSGKLVKVITEEITNHIDTPYSLEMLSKKYNFSKNHIINIFKKETGKTPYEYIANMRINKAKALLAYSNLSVKDISEQTGFGNYINFYKAFNKYENCSPLTWRKNILSIPSDNI